MGWDTLEEYFRKCHDAGIIDHAVRCRIVNGAVTFYIHPDGKDGSTEDFAVSGNQLSHDPNITKDVGEVI